MNKQIQKSCNWTEPKNVKDTGYLLQSVRNTIENGTALGMYSK